MKNQLDTFSSTGKQGELHHSRVNVKKVKAIIGLMESTGKGNIKKSGQAGLKKIFKQAGKIRTAHIELLLMKVIRTFSENKHQEKSLTLSLSC